MDSEKCILSDKKLLQRIIVALFVLFSSIIYIESNSIIHEGDEIHSLIFSTNNRNNFEDLKNAEEFIINSKDVNNLLINQKGINIEELVISVFQNDVHPPLYYLVLHIINFFIDDIETSAYILMTFLMITLIFFSIKYLKISIQNALWFIVLFPNLLIIIPEIRPYFLLFVISLCTYYFIKTDSNTNNNLLPISVLLILGVFCNYFFIFFFFSLLLNYSNWNILKNKKFFLLLVFSILVYLIVFFLVGDQLYNNSILNNPIHLVDRLTNFFIAFSSIFIPIWNIKLIGPEYFLFTLFVSGIFMFTISIFFKKRQLLKSKFQNKDFHVFITYCAILFFLYILGITPHYAIGGKYFILLSIPLFFMINDQNSGFIPRPLQLYLFIFFIITVFTKVYLDSNENSQLGKIINNKSNLYINKLDEFNVLRIVLEMKNDNKIIKEKNPVSNYNTKKRYLLSVKYLVKFESLKTTKKIDSLVLSNYNVTCLYLDN